MRLLIFLALTTSAQSIISGYENTSRGGPPPPPPPPAPGPGLPCTHAQAFIQSQSIGRIVNKPNNNRIEDFGGSLEAAASNTQSQYQHSSSEHQQHNIVGANQQYNINIPPPPPPPAPLPQQQQRPPQYLPPGPPQLQNFGLNPVGVQHPPQFPAQLFKPAHLPPGKVVPSQLIGGQINGHPSLHGPPLPPSYSSNSNSAGQQFNSGFQYASNYGAQQLSSTSAHTSLHQPNFHQTTPLSGGSHNFNSNQNSGSYAGAYTHTSFIPSASYSGSLNLASNSGLSGQLGQVIQETYANAPLDPTIEKHIYVHVPPEDLEDDSAKHAIQHAIPVQKRKHYKIIFIKAPSSTPNYAQLAAAAAPQTEEKTLVYVLVKKPDEPSIEELQQVQQQAIKTHKPEVYFIKYKTRKEGEPLETFNTNSFINDGHSLNQFSSSSGVDAIVDHSSDGIGIDSDLIDIRSGTGESGLTSSSSTSYSTSSSSSSSSASSSSLQLQYNGHSAYGVPLN